MCPGEMKTCHPRLHGVFTAATRQITQVSTTEKGANKTWLIRARERYSPRRRGALTQAAVWVLQTLSSRGWGEAGRRVHAPRDPLL